MRSSPLAALAALTALVAMVAIARHHERGLALATEAAATPVVVEPERVELPSVEALLAPLDVNTASATELERLPRIGPALAGRIVAHRPYTSVEELERVPGIGPRTIEALRAHVVVGTER
jgi:DNA uptake protein ComE-like DNA-binding protein